MDSKIVISPEYVMELIVDIKNRLITIENFIGQNYKRDYDGLKTLVMGFENNFAAIPEMCTRIEKLERHYYSDGDLSAIDGQIKNINKNNDFFETDLKRLELRCIDLEKEADTVESRLKELERHQDITHQQYKKVVKHPDALEPMYIEVEIHEIKQQIECLFVSLKGVETKLMGVPFQPLKPHKCPVCDGCGNDKGTTEANPNFDFCMKYASCHACEGKGIVWG